MKTEGEKDRLAAVDVAKLAAVAAVVWIHATVAEASQMTLAWCRFAVPFFACAAVFFVLRKASASQLSFAQYSTQRAQRIYVPFLIWGLVYLFARGVSRAVTGSGSPIDLSPALLLNGPAHHLWFLPFICFVSIAAYALALKFGPPQPNHARWWAASAFALGTAFAFIRCPVVLDTRGAPSSYFIDHSWEAMPSVFLGAAIFWALRSGEPSARLRWSLLTMAFAAVALDFAFDTHLLVVPQLAGSALFLFAVTQPARAWMQTLRPWAEVAFVIYLIHVLFIEVLQTIAERFGGVTSLAADLSVWALALVASGMTAQMLLRVRRLRWVVPG